MNSENGITIRQVWDLYTASQAAKGVGEITLRNYGMFLHIPAHRFMLVGGILLASPGIQALPKPPFYGKLLTALYKRVNKFFTEKLALALDEC